MQVLFTKQFEKDIRKITDKHTARNIEKVIHAVKDASLLTQIDDLKKLKGYKNAFRIRIGDFRIGLYIHDDVVEFSCFLHRKDIYKYFP